MTSDYFSPTRLQEFQDNYTAASSVAH